MNLRASHWTLVSERLWEAGMEDLHCAKVDGSRGEFVVGLLTEILGVGYMSSE